MIIWCNIEYVENMVGSRAAGPNKGQKVKALLNYALNSATVCLGSNITFLLFSPPPSHSQLCLMRMDHKIFVSYIDHR